MKSIKVILTLSVISIVILACGDSEKPAAIVAPEPKQPKPNLSPPVIKEIVVPDQVHAGSRGIKLEAVVEDPDGNSGLTYNWEAPGILPSYTKTWVTTWNPPIDMGVATITLTVNDGIHEAAQSADVEVIHPLIVPGEEIAGIRLIDGLDKITHLYGEPSRRFEREEDHKLFYKWDTRLDWENAGLTVYFRHSRIYHITISAPNPSKTAGGKGIGSTCDEARDDLTQITGYCNNGGRAPLGVPPAASYSNTQGYGWSYDGIQIECVLGTVVEYSIYKKEKKPFGWPFDGKALSHCPKN